MDHRAELIDVIRRVRNRWRLRLALRGAVIVCAGTIVALLLSASSLESLRFTPAAIITLPHPGDLDLCAAHGVVVRPPAAAARSATRRSRSISKNTIRRWKRRS